MDVKSYQCLGKHYHCVVITFEVSIHRSKFQYSDIDPNEKLRVHS